MVDSVSSSEGPGAVRTVSCRLEVAALVERSTHSAGVGWRLSNERRTGSVRTATRRRASSRIGAELFAVRRGVEEAERLGCASLVILVSEPAVASLLLGDRPKGLRRAGLIADRLGPALARFRSVRAETKAAPDPELEQAVGEALDVGLHAAAEREELRESVIEHVTERARAVRLESTGSGWLANGRYHVQLDPMRCDCPAWTARWAKAPISGRRGGRLPCKHLVALGARLGITEPAELSRLARRAFP